MTTFFQIDVEKVCIYVYIFLKIGVYIPLHTQDRLRFACWVVEQILKKYTQTGVFSW